jgi:hypothetical protein
MIMRNDHQTALTQMRMALVVLDEHGPSLCAAYLSQAVERLAEHLARRHIVQEGERDVLEFAKQQPQTR